MKKILLNIIVAAGLMGSVSAWAGKNDQAIVQEAQNNIVNVAQIAKLQDETGVTLNGQIVSHSKEDYYLLKDATGTIQLEIDDDLWRDAKLKVGDHVRVVGEVDTHRYKPTDIEVIRIEKHSH